MHVAVPTNVQHVTHDWEDAHTRLYVFEVALAHCQAVMRMHCAITLCTESGVPRPLVVLAKIPLECVSHQLLPRPPAALACCGDGSGVAMVTQADGNAAMALLLTVCSNLLGVVVVPFWLKAFFSGQNVSIDAVELLINLVLTGDVERGRRLRCSYLKYEVLEVCYDCLVSHVVNSTKHSNQSTRHM
jgi:SBF-like CPA transporter family (DUF4137)